jgi:enediyne biosynthesis thioesterase
MFLRQYAPDVLAQLSGNLALATVRCSCEYLHELRAFDEVVIRMRLASAAQNRISMDFEYWRHSDGGEQLVARGRQEVACMRREGSRMVPTPIPDQLREALRRYTS